MSELTGVVTQESDPARSRLIFMITFVVWWSLLAVFNAFPSIDILVARSVFTEMNCSILDGIGKTCGEFAYDKSQFFSAIRRLLFLLPYVAVAVLVVQIVRARLYNGIDWRTPQVDMSVAGLVSLTLGCGLIVNLFLKTFSGRPRPRETSLFGGQLDFVQAGSFAGKCVKNCSFVSGEASSAGWLFCLILLLPPRLRLPIGLPLVIISFFIPVMRVLTGAHYLSDVILGWLSSVVIFAGVLAAAEQMTRRRYI